MGRPRGSLNPLVGHQVEVPLRGMIDALVHHGSRQNVAVLKVLVSVLGKESGVVTLLHDQIGDAWLVFLIQSLAKFGSN